MTSPSDKGRKPRAFEADDPAIKVSEPSREEPIGGPEGAGAGAGAGARTGEGTGEEGKTGVEGGLGDAAHSAAAVPPERRQRFGWLGTLVAATFALAALAFSLWYAHFVSTAVLRDDWLGWAARGLATIIVIAIVVLVLRELLGIWRLSRLGRLRSDANKAINLDDIRIARKAVSRLKANLSGHRDLRWELDRFREQERHKRDARSLLGLADRILLEQADSRAQELIYQSARRVGVVSAVVPIAFVVVLFVLFENLRMVRRVAGNYGGQPGFLGGLRLFTWIIGHIAASGVIALTDDLWGQFFGQDLLRRVSARLGEGAFNGALTARLGVAAISICRPLPFVEARPPRARDIFYQAFPDLRPDILKKVWKSKGE
ncbi:MAG: TIGR01620 family protein [Alphaproteobacteria bacterium]|nr:TIGR01620 family protein [Alphaproteobacteria bacterium]